MVQLIRPGPSVSTMAQGAMPPWRNDEEAEDYARDPRGFLLDLCGIWLPHSKVMHNLVLCATYFLPAFELLPNGTKFFRSEKSHDEALWQGKVGLVIAKGRLAFVDEPGVSFRGQNVEIGEWVQWDIHDARQCVLNRVHCRFVKDTQIIMTWDDPRLVY
jgi:hypothetical protein